jgi:hypothetical protein
MLFDGSDRHVLARMNVPGNGVATATRRASNGVATNSIDE